MTKNYLTVFIVLMLLSLTACTHLGPKTVPRDRFDYNTAISTSWKDQTLLNIVKIRYADFPLFVEVASIVSGYSMESSVNLGSVMTEGSGINDIFSFGTNGKFTDRPTITYVPITGQKFNRSFMTPIPPGTILFLIQSGWQIDLVFPLAIDTINGFRGGISSAVNQKSHDSEYDRIIKLLRKIQLSGGIGMKIIKGKDDQETTVMFLRQRNVAPEVKALQQEFESLIGLRPGLKQIELIYGQIPEKDSEIAILTRSMIQIMIELALEVSVPPEHISDGRTVSALPRQMDEDGKSRKLITINSSATKPENSFVSVFYRDHWFWVDDCDFKSKRAFSFLMILFSTMETGGKEGLPLVTIPTG